MILLLCCLASFKTPCAATWTRTDSSGFTLISDGDTALVKNLAEDLDRFRFYLPDIIPDIPLHPNAPPLTVYLLSRSAGHRRSHHCSLCAGFFLQTPTNNYIVINPGDREFLTDDLASTRHYLYHEFVHYYLANSAVPNRYPVWYMEGIAELLASFHYDGNTIRLGNTRDDFWLIDLADEVPIEALFKASTPPDETREAARFYNHAWILYRYFHNSDKRRQQLSRYIQLRNDGISVDDAFARAFNDNYRRLGNKVQAFNDLLERGNHQPRFLYRHITPRKPYAADSLKQRALHSYETDYYIGTLLQHTEGDKTEIVTLFKRSIERQPSFQPAYLSLTQYYLQNSKPYKALFYINRARERTAESPALLSGYADTLLALAVADFNAADNIWPTWADRARSQYLRSLQLSPHDTQAQLGIAYYHLLKQHAGADSDFAEGSRFLQYVRNKLHDVSIDLMQGKLQLAQGNRSKAIKHLQAVAHWDPASDNARQAVQLLHQTQP